MTSKQFREECLKMKEWLVESAAPKDTGNLAYNSIKVEFPTDTICKIYVDTAIAPYMVFTEYPWVSPRWNGKKNPNEGWFKRAARSIADRLCADLQGVMR